MDVGLAVIGASQTMSAGKIAEMESKTEAKQIETAAAQREADRKEALANAVSNQAAMGGASGISFEGSPLAILEEDMRQESMATERDEMMTRIGAGAARARGKVAKQQAKAGAILGLLTDLNSSAKSAMGMPAKQSAQPTQSAQQPVTRGYGTAGNPAQPQYSGTGGGRRWSKKR